MFLVGVEGSFCAVEDSDLVLGAAAGGLVLAGVTTTHFLYFPFPVIRERLGVNFGGVSVAIGFKSLLSSDS